jgi:hypothetical protein
MVEQRDAAAKSLPSESYRRSYGEVYQQVLSKIKELDVEIEQQESLYNRECSHLSSLDADINRSNATIRMEISNHNFQVAARPYAVADNSVVARQYAVGLLVSRRDAQLSKVVDMREKIDEIKKERDTQSRIFSNMNADIIAWLDEDKVQQAATERIDAHLAELHRVRDEFYEVLRQIKDVEADIKKYQS